MQLSYCITGSRDTDFLLLNYLNFKTIKYLFTVNKYINCLVYEMPYVKYLNKAITNVVINRSEKVIVINTPKTTYCLLVSFFNLDEFNSVDFTHFY